MLVFNLAIRISRRYLEYWGAEICETYPDAPFVLLGNKSDRPEQKVTLDEMKQMTRNLGAVD